MQPFSFYGAYVQLNNTEKQSFIANNSITYLKLQNLDMLEAIKQQKIEIETLISMREQDAVEREALMD